MRLAFVRRAAAAGIFALGVSVTDPTTSCAEPTVAAADPARGDPASRGPFDFRHAATNLLCPHTSERRPVVVLMREGAADLGDLGEHLASWGFIVFVGDSLPTELTKRSGDHDDCNASRVIGWVGVGRGGHEAWRYAGPRDDVDQRAVVAIDPGPRGPDDAVERWEAKPDKGETLVLIAEPNPCVAPIAKVERGTSRPGTYVHVVGGSHCDAQGPDAAACENACGPSTPAARSTVRRLTTAWLLVHVADDRRAEEWLPPTREDGVRDVVRVPQILRPPPSLWTIRFQPSLLLGSTLHTGDRHSDFTIGIRSSFMWERKPERTWGWGPYAEALLLGGDPDFGIGMSSRVSLLDRLGITPGAGAYVRRFDSWQPGLTGGVRIDLEGEHHRPMLGIRVDGRFGFGHVEERAIFVGADIDGLLLAIVALLPFGFSIGD